jgi:glucose 1-dehydrogenase
MKLVGTTALVTGGSSGIGRCAALALADGGARVAVNYLRHPIAAAEVVEEIRSSGGVAIAVRGDVTDPSDVNAIQGAVEAELGVPQVIVSSAGSSIRRDVFQTTFNLFQTAAKRLRDMQLGGSFLAIGSVHATIPFPNALAYNVAKAGLDQMVRTFAAELLPYAINVNVLTPGLTDTPGERQFRTDEELLAVAHRLPMGRMATPEEIGRLAAWLVSGDNSYMTGSIVTADGGIGVHLGLPGVASPPGGDL